MLSPRVPHVSGRVAPYLRTTSLPPTTPYLALGGMLTLLAAYASRNGGLVGLGLLLGLLMFLLLLAAFIVFPHVAVAFTIPYFTLLPMLKTLVLAKLAPTKDIMIVAAAIAAAISVIERRQSREPRPIDQVAVVTVLLLMGLYFVDVGAGISGGNRFGLGWFHGVRLVWEPLLLLLFGMTARNPRRTLRWAFVALILAALVAASYGLLQQVVGPGRLVTMGYAYAIQVRTMSGHLRSFGTLDQAFDYATVLAFGLTAVLLWARRRASTVAIVLVLVAGLAASLVRGAAISVAALIAILLARSGRVATAVLLLMALVAAAVVFVLAATRPTPGRVVQAGPSIYLTLNGRTKSWREALGRPSNWAFGRGVGLYGTAAQRARRTSYATTSAQGAPTAATDSGYLATLSDVGFVGLAVLLTLFGRVLFLFRRAAARGDRFGWAATGLVTVMLLDAALRSSFTGFPTADIVFLLIGLAVAATTVEPPPPQRRAAAV